MSISETWLDSGISDGEISIPGYSVTRPGRNRCDGSGAVFVQANCAQPCCEILMLLVLRQDGLL